MSKEIDALLQEREGYFRRGLKDRVKAVDDALKALGFDNKYVPVSDVEFAAIVVEQEIAVARRGKKRKV